MAQRVGIFYANTDSIIYVMCNLFLFIHSCCYADRVLGCLKRHSCFLNDIFSFPLMSKSEYRSKEAVM